MQNSYTESENPFVRSPRTDRPVPMPLLSALLAVHAYSAPLAGRPAVTRAAAGSMWCRPASSPRSRRRTNCASPT